MGEREFWRCPGCGYRELVSDGVDTGTHKAVVTIACDDCRELLEVLIREPASTVEEKLDRCPSWEPEQLTCPYNRRHEVQLWRYGGPCPRCGEGTERDPDEPALYWN